MFHKVKNRKHIKKRKHAKKISDKLKAFFDRMKGQSGKKDKSPPSPLKELNVWQRM